MDNEDKKPRKKWTAEEVGYLRRNLPHKSVETLAKELSRPVSSVKAAAYGLGLLRDDKYPP
jgi:hypothetical protein